MNGQWQENFTLKKLGALSWTDSIYTLKLMALNVNFCVATSDSWHQNF